MHQQKAEKSYRIQYTIKDEYDISLTYKVGRLFEVLVGSAFKIGIVNQPIDAVGGIPFLHQPILSIQDKGGNTINGKWKGTVCPIILVEMSFGLVCI